MMAAQPTTPPRALATLLEGLLPPAAARDQGVSGLRLDSRLVRPGDLFLACAGTRVHGMDHLAEALGRGAVAVLAEPDERWPADRIAAAAQDQALPLVAVPGLGALLSTLAARFHGEPARDLRVIGVTGTNGKTSCTQFLAEALDPIERCAVVGTLGHGFPGDLEPGRHTTPDALELQAILAELRRAGARSVAMEVSSHALDQHRAAAVPFETAVLTNLSRDHLDYHGSMDRYGAAKLRLFRSPGLRNAVINLDDAFAPRVLDALSRDTEVVAYGLGGVPQPGRAILGHVRAERVSARLQGLVLELDTSWGRALLRTPLLGRFNAGNLLAVLGVLLLHGLPLETAVGRLEQVQPVFGRMQALGGDGRPLAVVDYAHTPDALEKVLQALREHCAGRLVCVFGCGGERDRGKRPQMGAVAARLADRVILTDDNPRGEDGDAIVADILVGVQDRQDVAVERNRAEAIRLAVAAAGPRDVIAVCGKGHEECQVLGDLRIPFSDSSQVRRALEGWGR
ncbi:MAG: UDP-N-acetylmuramoyl-L-alanyl-D-glutamate--2,6-diaminopimelate ligase [Chromatiales bacterium]|jgi:UDP-N-acetylmuramoyl-L-alanyl-D-glutamate--2,6-diaminopimelate ligase